MRAFIYIRISDADQSHYSIESQERLCVEYCGRNKLEIVKSYTDNGESSYTFDREFFNKLENDIERLQPSYLIVYHLDRFSRNLAEALLKIRSLGLLGLKVRDITEPVDLDDDHPNTFMTRSIRFMVAESELHRIRSRTREGMRQMLLNGRYASMAPYGYINSRDEENRPVITIDEEKAALIRIIFREYLNGMNLYDIHRLVNMYGFKQRGRSAIKHILQNPVYAGLIRVPATKTEPIKIIKGIHAAIVSEHDYWIIQERLNGKTMKTQVKEEVPLRGVLQTENGRNYTAGNSRSKSGRYYWYYVDPDTKKGLPANRLHAEFYDMLDILSFTESDIAWFRDDLTKKLNEFVQGREQKVKDVKNQIRIVQKQIDTVEEKYLKKPDVSEQTFNRVISELRADKARLQKELAGLNTNQQAYWERLEDVMLRLTDLRETFDKLQLHKKHQFIKQVFDKGLGYWNNAYRTPELHPLFAHNELTLKKKGLLLIVPKIVEINKSSISAPPRTGIAHSGIPYIPGIDGFVQIFAAC